MNMPNHSDFAPIGTLTSASSRLEIDFAEQQYLAQQMGRMSDQLSDAPLIAPEAREVSLGRIPARDHLGHLGIGNSMGLSFSETQTGLFNATIGFSESGDQNTQFQFLPTGDIWEQWRPRATEPQAYLENSELITLLRHQLPDEAILDSLADKPKTTAPEIVHLLASHLKGISKRRYDALKYIAPVPGRVANVSLFDVQVNYIKNQQLAVSSFNKIGDAVINKTYTYVVRRNNRGVKDASGAVTMSSKDGISKSRLEAFTAIDQDDNYPVDILNDGIAAMRAKYDLFEEKRKVA